jgi:hypothetical protein
LAQCETETWKNSASETAFIGAGITGAVLSGLAAVYFWSLGYRWLGTS